MEKEIFDALCTGAFERARPQVTGDVRELLGQREDLREG